MKDPVMKIIVILFIFVLLGILLVSRLQDSESITVNDPATKTETKLTSDPGSKKITPVKPEIDPVNPAITDGLVAYYPFNGNANDESGNNNNGIVNGAKLTSDRFGKTNSAYYFDGKSWIVVKDHPSLRPSKSITLCAWVKIEQSTVNDYLRIITKHGEVTNKGGSHGSYQLLTGRKNERGKIYSTLKTDKKYFSSNPTSDIDLNIWHFIASTWDGNRFYTYVDGEITSLTNASGHIQYDKNSLYFGKDGYYDHVFYKGFIDDIRIYNKALSSEDIIVLYKLKK